MTQKSILDRIRDSLETTGVGLEQQVKRQYSHECGHMAVAARRGFVTGDGVATADRILRETMALDGWRTMDAAARCEAIKRAFYLAWRSAFGLRGEPDHSLFGPTCCGFARAMRELIPGFPAEDSVAAGEQFNMKRIAEELEETARRAANNEEAELDQKCHLFFFSAVDSEGQTRFFDIMKGQDFSLAETATSAPQLRPCVETAYQNATGVRHHVHRNYGQVRMKTAREAMEQIAKQTILTHVTELAETLTHREALPVWKAIFEKLGCESVAFGLESVTDYRIETDQGTSNAGQNRRILVVHHERLIAEFIFKLLADEGYETRMEFSSADAVRAAREFVPRLLIIDPVMPGILGLDAAKEISDVAKCKVLLISAGARDAVFADILGDLRNHGCDCDAFALPIEGEELLRHVHHSIGVTVRGTGAGRVQANAPADGDGSTAKISLKTCPHCQEEVLTLITDYATGKRYCYHCVPNPGTCPGAVFISRKMDQLHAVGKLDAYSVEQRLKDLKDPPRCECGVVLDVLDGDLCSKCEGEALRIAQAIHQSRAPHPVTKENPAKNEKRRIEGDVGPEVVDFVFREMHIDAEWSTRNERGFTWWGHGLAQRLWADPVFLEDGDETVRVHAETDVLRNVPDDLKTAQALGVINTGASLSAFVWETSSKKIKLRCSAIFHVENFYWLSKLFLSTVAIQAAEADRCSPVMARVFGAEVDESAHPRSGPRPHADEMLDIIEWYAQKGTAAAALSGDVFESAIEWSSSRPWVMANADHNGLTAEFPFPGCMPPTALLRVRNDQRHPILGRGLLILLRLPLTCETADADILCAKLNVAEEKQPTRCHFMGAWCTDPREDLFQKGIMLTGVPVPARNTGTSLTFCSFLPAAFYQNGLLKLMIYGMAHRAWWANEYLSSKEGMPELFGRRDPAAYEQQVETHSSFIRRIGALAVQQRQKKPN
jgi:CheY-like chemotaxis protein